MSFSGRYMMRSRERPECINIHDCNRIQYHIEQCRERNTIIRLIIRANYIILYYFFIFKILVEGSGIVTKGEFENSKSDEGANSVGREGSEPVEGHLCGPLAIATPVCQIG